MEIVDDLNAAAAGRTSSDALSLNAGQSNRAVLKELNSNDSKALSPLTTKPHTTNKLTPSPHPQPNPSTAGLSAIAASVALPLSPTAAAGTAVFPSNPSAGKLNCTDSEFRTGLLDATFCALNNNITNVNKGNKFAGLTEFDESKIPELPGSLNASIDDHLKLTFADDLIPTLTANVNQHFKSREDNVSKRLQVQMNATDTELSSDNETFAECQSFLELGGSGAGHVATRTTTPSVDLVCAEYTASMSEADTYCSALNSHNMPNIMTAADAGMSESAVLFDATMENVAEICDELIEPIQGSIILEPGWQDLPTPPSHSTKRGSLAKNLTNTTFYTIEGDGGGDGEPMDVDMIEYDKVGCVTSNVIPAVVITELQHKVESFASPTESPKEFQSAQTTPEKEQYKNYSNIELNITNDANKADEPQCGEQSTPSAISKSTNEATNNKRLSFPLKSTEKLRLTESIKSTPETVVPKDIILDSSDKLSGTGQSSQKENVLIQDNSVDSATNLVTATSATVFLATDQEHKVVVPLATRTGNSNNATTTTTLVTSTAADNAEQLLNDTQKCSVPAPVLAGANLDLNHGSYESVSTTTSTISVHSPSSFPLKSAVVNNQFPQRPNSVKPIVFLEKSDYCNTKSNDHQLSPGNDNQLSMASVSLPNEPNLNETVSMSSASSPSSMQNSLSVPSDSSKIDYNSITAHESHCLSAMTSSDGDLQRKVDVDKRRTFNVSPNTSVKSTDNLNTTSRSTFSVPTELADSANEGFEAMDVDCSMQAASPKATPTEPNSSATSITETNSTVESLSAKEQTKSNSKDEKDIFIDSAAALPTVTMSSFMPNAFGVTDDFAQEQNEFITDEDFQNNIILNPADFDYLLTKGNTNVQVDRSSLLLRFDPLLGVNQLSQFSQTFSNSNNNNNNNNNNIFMTLSPTLEENEQQNERNSSSDLGLSSNNITETESTAKSAKIKDKSTANNSKQLKQQEKEPSADHTDTKKNATMSVDVIKDMKIENDCRKSIENSHTQSDEKIQNNCRMDELEKKIRNEVLKTEDIEKKLKEAEQREEALIKRITEKDKSISKMKGVIEAYEKAIAELISEKEQLLQNYEKQLAEVRADRDSNYHHLTSLETTFSDLHVKYEKSKEMTTQLKSSEEALLAEKKQNAENLRLQEQRYEKMKNHAMLQLEIANKKLESLAKEHSIETTKLKALLKKAEISRESTNEQLQQKTRENAELVKICDELINGQGS